MLNRILTAPASSWPRLFLIFQQQAQSRHIQAYFHEPQLAKAAGEVHYDGAMVSGSNDYLMINDANVGATKGDFYAHKAATLKTVVLPSGVVRHELDVTYQMPLPVDATDRGLNPGEGSYRDYVRFYLPQTATVASFQVLNDGAPGDGGLDNITVDRGFAVVGAFSRLPRGHQTQIRMLYEVPSTGDPSYDLLVQKAAGAQSLPLTLA